MFRGFKECIFLEKVKTVLQNLENHKVLLKDPVRRNEGPWLVRDPVGCSADSETPVWLGLKCIWLNLPS